MKNMKIGMRLGLAFGFVLALLAVIVFIAVSRLSILYEDTSLIVNDEYPKVIQAPRRDFRRHGKTRQNGRQP